MRARVLIGRIWGPVLFATLTTTACSPRDEAPLALIGEEHPPVAEETEIEPPQRSAARFGGSAAEFDEIVLFPVALQGPGLGAFSTDCDLDDDPFSSCL